MTKNHIILGVFIGSVIPALAWVLFEYEYKDVLIRNKPGVPYLIVIALNLVLLRICFRRNLDQTSRGIMLVTFIFMMLVFLLKIKI